MHVYMCSQEASKTKTLEVVVDGRLVGFRDEWLFNPSELNTNAETIKEGYDKLSEKYDLNLVWFKIHKTLSSNGIDPSFSILTVAKYLFELDKEVDIKLILENMKKQSDNLDHLFHDFSVIKLAYAYFKNGYSVEFRENTDLIINSLKIEVKRRMGFLHKNRRKLRNEKALSNFLRSMKGYFKKQIKKGIDKQKADVLIYEVTTHFGFVFMFFLEGRDDITVSKDLPKLQKNMILLFNSQLIHD